MKTLKYIVAIGLIALTAGCYYDNAAEMYPAAALDTNCDTTGTLTYNENIKPIFNGYCGAENSCHSSSIANGGVILETYQSSILVDDATMIGCIEQTSGYSPMPPAGKLSNCSITQIKKWIEQGKPE
jgi:cytochrome c5